jgi:PAS domain S-box-containing protein
MGKSPNKIPESYFSDNISNLKGFAIFKMDQEGIITSWNKGCELMKGYTSEEAIGQHFEILLPDFLREKNIAQKELDQVFTSGRYEGEAWRRKKNGELFWAYVVLTKVVDEDGELQGYIKITQDHTERKKLEHELRKNKADLEITNLKLEKVNQIIERDLDGFIYTAAHDLSTPIMNMEGLLSLMIRHDCYQDKNMKRLTDMLSASVKKLRKTIYDLLEISKIQRSAREDIEEIKFKEIIDECILKIKDLVENSRAKIEIDINNCPVINFSKTNVSLIIYNLLNNSLKYRSPERVPEILIKTSKTDGWYLIMVKDNGIGIKKENQGKVFHMFKRFHENVEGTGIGLYMVKRIVDEVGGKIEVDSELGKGSTFTVYLKG